VAVYVVWKRVAFDFTPAAMHHANAKIEEIPADNLDAILDPYKVSSDRVQVAGKDDVYERKYIIGTTGTTHEYKKVVEVKPSWVLFGEGGVPADNAHTIPYRTEIEESSKLPLTRLVLVGDMLKAAAGGGSYVGKYVLYAGKTSSSNHRLLDAAGNLSPKRWMEGIIISHDATTSMCEVLYMNGWVIWHDTGHFGTTRSTNLKLYDTFSQLLQGMDPGMTLQRWVEGMNVFEYFIGQRVKAKHVSGENRRNALDAIVQDMKGLYKGLA
jgi:hypothetical protein